MQGSFPKPLKWPERETFIPSDKETINWWRIHKMKGFGCRVVNGEEVTGPVYTAFLALHSLSLVIRMSSFLPIQGGSIPQGTRSSCLQGRRRRGEVRVASCFRHFLKLRQLKIFNMPRCHILGPSTPASLPTPVPSSRNHSKAQHTVLLSPLVQDWTWNFPSVALGSLLNSSYGTVSITKL